MALGDLDHIGWDIWSFYPNEGLSITERLQVNVVSYSRYYVLLNGPGGSSQPSNLHKSTLLILKRFITFDPIVSG